jgi:hypothetical protein
MRGAYLSKNIAGAKKKPFFFTQGVIKKGVLLDSTPFLGLLSQSDKSYF